MLVRKPRGGASGPITFAVTILIGLGAGVYIWGPTLHKYMNSDPEILAYREKARIERDLERTAEKTKKF